MGRGVLARFGREPSASRHRRVAFKAALPMWIIARQHPGETMEERFVEGLKRRLVDAADHMARDLRGVATSLSVPRMNYGDCGSPNSRA